jgi:polysaccharide pyruvyl transferase WcaK-like protein
VTCRAERSTVVLNAYSRRNVGDWLLCVESVRIAQAIGGGAVTTIAFDPESFLGRTAADVVLPSPIGVGRLAVGAVQFLLAMASRGRRGDPSVAAIARSSCAISVGGGFLQVRSRRELLSVGLVHGLQFVACVRCGVPYAILPQSIGPFEGRVGRAMARWLLRHAAAIAVRDEASLQRLNALGGEIAAKAELRPDLAFAAPRARPKSVGSPRPKVAVVARQWWFPGLSDPSQRERIYYAQCAALIDDLRGEGNAAELIVHSDGPTSRGDDSIAARHIARLVTEPIMIRSVVGCASLADVEHAYSQFDCVVTTRLHAALLALRVGVPVFGIAYETKMSEIFGQLGLSEWWTAIDRIDVEQVKRAVAHLETFPHETVDRQYAIHERNVKQYVAQLQTTLRCARTK